MDAFLADAAKSPIVKTKVYDTEELNSYLRAGRNFFLHGQRKLALTVARVEVLPEYQRKGICNSYFQWLEAAARIHGYDVIVVESVFNLNLRDSLLRKFYHIHPVDGSSLFKLL